MKKVGAHAISQHQQALKEYAEWEWQFGQVTAFVQAHGHAELGAHPVGEWLRRQMRLAEAGELTPGRQERLEQLRITLPAGVKKCGEKAVLPLLPVEDAEWERMHAQLDAWHQLHGHCRVPRSGAEYVELARWVRNQRRQRVAQKLPMAKTAWLEALGLFGQRNGMSAEERWEQRFEELVAYAREHGHTKVKEKHNRGLAHWRDTQRQLHHKGTLSAERVARLEGIGFEWEAAGRGGLGKAAWHQQAWEEKLERLRAFQARFGHCHVPRLWAEDPKLGQWTGLQRKYWRKGTLTADRVARLEALGMEWQVPYRCYLPPFPPARRPRQGNTDRWAQRLAELTAYAREHGHTRVKLSENEVLSHWRNAQMKIRRKGGMSAERIALLDGIGFDWESPYLMGMGRVEAEAHAWAEKLERLRAFHARFGHTQVPAWWPEDRELAKWVTTQRFAKSKGRLLSQREARLDELGFEWRVVKLRMHRTRREPRRPESLNVLWEQRYAELVAFHAQHGHCLVPSKRGVANPLNRWCYRQRDMRRAGKLRAEQVARLDALGFAWETSRR